MSSEEVDRRDPRRHYPRVTHKQNKDEWEAYNIHLGEAQKVIEASNKAVKHIKAHELREDYELRKEKMREAKVSEQESKRREWEEVMQTKHNLEAESHQQNLYKRVMQNQVANDIRKYQDLKNDVVRKKKENELVEDIKRLDKERDAIDSEVRRRHEERMKELNYRQSNLELDQQRRMQKLADKNETNQKVADMIKESEDRLLMKEKNYKNWYQNIDEQQRNLQALHYEKVVLNNQKLDKEKEDLAMKSLEHATRRRMKEDMDKRDKYYNEMEQFKHGVDRQLDDKHTKKYIESLELQRGIEERLQATKDYEESLKMQKAEKTKFQEIYRDSLDRQNHEKESGPRGVGMTKLEKRFNHEDLQAYKDHDPKLFSLVPGYISSKYIHPYSLEAKYAGAIPYKELPKNFSSIGKMYGDGTAEMTAKVHSSAMFGEPQRIPEIVRSHHQSVTAIDVPAIEKLSSRRAEARSLRDTEPEAKRSLSNFSAASIPTPTRHFHNPILNPVPFNNQNPYIMRQFEKNMREKQALFAPN